TTTAKRAKSCSSVGESLRRGITLSCAPVRKPRIVKKVLFCAVPSWVRGLISVSLARSNPMSFRGNRMRHGHESVATGPTKPATTMDGKPHGQLEANMMQLIAKMTTAMRMNLIVALAMLAATVVRGDDGTIVFRAKSVLQSFAASPNGVFAAIVDANK